MSRGRVEKEPIKLVFGLDVMCDVCNGRGRKTKNAVNPCPGCDGRGFVRPKEKGDARE